MKILLLVSLIFLPGCFATARLRMVDPGMTTKDVEQRMGRRDSFASAEKDGHTYLLHKYTNQLCDGWAWDRCDTYIVYKDGVVIETGVSDIRAKPTNMQFLYLFNVN